MVHEENPPAKRGLPIPGPGSAPELVMNSDRTIAWDAVSGVVGTCGGASGIES